jgi:fused signal recognition particle receptor
VIGVYITIAVVVAVLAVVAGTVSATRARRRRRDTTAAPPTRPAGQPPPAGPPAQAAPPAAAAAAPVEAPPGRAPAAPPPEPAVGPAPAAPPEPPAVREPEAPLEPEAPPEPEAPVATYRSRLGNVRGLFSGAVSALRSGRIDAATWDSLEEALIRADVGVTTATALLDELRAKVDAKEIRGGDDLLAALGRSIRELLDTADSRALRFDGVAGSPDVWLIVGVNGVGKTTTIGKLARRQSSAGRSVLLAAGDTFRAAAADQLALWAERTGTEIVRGAEGGDPSAIVFDAVQRAAARGNDLVLADTAGRLHTKTNLVEELKKIRRVAGREPGNVTEVLLVLDATTGQNAVVQARQFTEAVEVTGVVLTKLDGTAKGGIVVAVQRELGLPVKLVGLGEGPDDLVDFDPDEFVDALLASD